MRKYYLFNVKEEITRIYKDNPYGLYKTLENLYGLKIIKYEVALYKELCNLIDINVITYYIEHTYVYKKHLNKYLFNDILIEVNRSVIVVMSDYNLPAIFRCFNIYSKNFFVIDFKNNDYFWLDRYITIDKNHII